MEIVRALELYSGIGGFHYSVLQTLINYIHSSYSDIRNTSNGIISNSSGAIFPLDISKKIKNVVRFISIDLNPIANETYYHNFKENTIYLTNKKDINKFFKNVYNSLNNQTSSNILKSETKKYKEKKNSQNKNTNHSNNHIENNIKNNDNCNNKFGDSNFISDLNDKDYILQTDINNLTPEFFDHFKFYILLISNPCQPYTRLNKNFKEINLNQLYNENNYINKEFPKENPNDGFLFNQNEFLNNDSEENSQKCPYDNLNECHHFNNKPINKHNDNISNIHDYNSIWNNEKDQFERCNINKQSDIKTEKNSEGEEIDQNYILNNLKIDDKINPFDIEKDKRVYSFFHVCNLLKNMNVNNLPKYIFIENVKNFESSFSFLYFINSIKNNYNFQTYLLSPLQFGIPNERLRFYCICKRKSNDNDNSDFESKKNEQNSFLSYTNSLKPRNFLSLKKKNENTFPRFYTPTLATFLDHNKKYFVASPKLNKVNILNEKLQEFEVTKSILQKQSAYCFDIIDVNKNENICCFEANNYYNEKNNYINNSCNKNNNLKVVNNFKQLHATCFTSNYARFINGSGSILYFNNKDEQNNSEQNTPTPLQNYYDQLRKIDIPTSQNTNLAVHNKNNYDIKENEIKKYENHVRYFTPTEICRLMGYKMHTNKLIDFNQIDKNIYGNIYWNIDHINHVCAYTDNIHYCDIMGTNTCILNSNNNIAPINNRRDSKQNYIQNNSCLCHEFQFHEFLTNKQKYKLIGNSVNVTVISLIFQTYNVFKDILNI
ncbi:DNA (cytosine-5)-methyltransferase, putative [Plasmodium berghei]|uniref:DNA (Cytosine-5)-methyltransferase, putative n=2 Tax=Plasmodium berghei TaxID=5821 RepID=A0A509AEU1_PLABA|nr:DNA (cytosine-5)-methyltransferase, putative [Plasmodium berghei ANKA]CXH89259.1 DNA (cytosine-5)-methyltransferase, putative [Plasmodium berghei]SCL90313.1 DNA (cytosine-5)-methyltransferase, putative [Plasmodium berghei]SCM15265.1 DNA (cytosine-5)-methyltransferase, putative [Plasmodium berghei]SCM17060.1 DNA (cytosine-5)-methyltransferase, putative [Plasmodium berghei]SCN21952.1 DNA (cytosine-5)-methyltransferase, putative [Plasmodium berghei]|eukprot:XP_034419840.1 DNA (cytosine-5)-methyltransferase, putative [Plasmodium berghei ANKA]